mgnify:CR=1 FL=1
MSDHTVQEKLEATAKQAAKTSYSPYSHFPVGAAILTLCTRPPTRLPHRAARVVK